MIVAENCKGMTREIMDKLQQFDIISRFAYVVRFCSSDKKRRGDTEQSFFKGRKWFFDTLVYYIEI